MILKIRAGFSIRGDYIRPSVKAAPLGSASSGQLRGSLSAGETGDVS